MPELTTALRVLRRWWYLLVVPVVVAAALLLPGVLRDPVAAPRYQTVVRFSAAQQPGALPNREGDYQDVWLASELTVRALASWAATDSFRDAVAARAAEQGLPNLDLRGLGLAVDQQRSVGQLFLVWPDADELAVIAGAAIATLQEDSERAFPAQLGGQPARVTVLDAPRVAAAPLPLADRYAPLARLALAFVGGAGLVVLAALLDPALHTRADVEALGLPVLAAIPRR